MRDSGIRFLSHEIRSPLTSFKLISSVFAELADQLSDTGSAKLIEVVSNEADRMLRLVGQFLDVAALDEGSYRLNLREVDVSQLIHKVADALQIKAAEKGISVSTMCAEDIPLIQADPDRLEDVLHNLCENALKYTDAGGQISLAADVDDTDVQIAVSDTGRGIPADMHEAIFEEFVQAHHDVEGTRLEAGVGLGLYMVRRLVELHGGRVEVASEVGRGATFTIHLPIVLQSASPARPPTHG